MPLTAKADFLTLYGGPTFDGSNGYTRGYTEVPYGSSAGSGFGVANAHKYILNGDTGVRAVRWDDTGTWIELGNLGINNTGTTLIEAYGTNDTDTAVGEAEKWVNGVHMGSSAVRWDASGTTATELGNLGTGSNGITNSSAAAINNSGTIVGSAYKFDAGAYIGQRAVRWDTAGTATELGNLGTASNGNTNSYASAINEDGTIVGIADKYVGGINKGHRAIRWDASGTAATELGNLGTDSNGVTVTDVYKINESGTAVGVARKYLGDNYLGNRAVRWNVTGTAATELDNLGTDGTGYAENEASDINNVGTAVGWATKFVAGNQYDRAVRWDASGTVATELGTLDSLAATSFAHSINDSGITVGYQYTFDESTQRAVMWGPDGVAIDLNSLIDPSSGWVLTEADDINNDNWITGVGSFDPDGPGVMPAYNRLFLIHVPEPTSMALLAIGSLTLLVRRRNRLNNYNTCE